MSIVGVALRDKLGGGAVLWFSLHVELSDSELEHTRGIRLGITEIDIAAMTSAGVDAVNFLTSALLVPGILN
eukprot:1611278-Amphidinium_carterae.1